MIMKLQILLILAVIGALAIGIAVAFAHREIYIEPSSMSQPPWVVAVSRERICKV